MIKYLILIMVLLNTSTCKPQEKKQDSIQKKYIMNEADTKLLESLIGNPFGDVVKLSNGNEMQYFDAKDKVNYVFRIKDKITPITYIKGYYLKTKTIHLEYQDFYSRGFGMEREYDESGKLISEKDFEKDYKFSIENVCELIKKEYDIDLMKAPNSSVDKILYDCNRIKKEIFKGDIRYCYFVSIGYNIEEGASKMIAIDGTTGKILYDIPYEPGFGLDKLPKSKTPIINPKGILLK
jgi:hypothetical protein